MCACTRMEFHMCVKGGTEEENGKPCTQRLRAGQRDVLGQLDPARVTFTTSRATIPARVSTAASFATVTAADAAVQRAAGIGFPAA